jgi:ESF2/ABP1 family protein
MSVHQDNVHLDSVKKYKGPKPRSNDRRGRNKFIDGWIEFLYKKDAKTAALALNGTSVGGKKSNRFHDELWTLKYLSKLRWSHLTEQISYENAVKEQKMRAEIAQAKRENSAYIRQVDKAKTMEKIEAKRALKRQNNGESEVTVEKLSGKNIKLPFRQRKPIKP